MPLPVTIGADVELGNSWTGTASRRSNLEAASQVLGEVARIPTIHSYGSRRAWNPPGDEWGRIWTGSGGCIYCDMSHVELATAETASARDHAAAFHGQVRIIRSALRRARARLSEGADLFVNVHVSDGTLPTSWGAHLNLLVRRVLWNDLITNKPHKQSLFASFIAATAPVLGQGVVLPLGDQHHFLTSARACHLGSLMTLSTTEPFNRGLLNSRDEAHAASALARLHIIAFDSNLAPAAILLRAGLTQLVLAALEDGWFDAELLLEDPVAAVRAWSLGFDPRSGEFRPSQAERPGGSSIGLIEWHRRLLAQIRPLVESQRIPEQVVPEGPVILDLWESTLEDLARSDLLRLAARLDWALKWLILSELRPRPDSLSDARIRLLDQLYGHVDDQVGLFWKFWRDGLVERIVDDEQIGRWMVEGDPATRSGLRGELVNRLWPWIVDMDWSYIDLLVDGRKWSGARWCRIELPDPSTPSGPAIRASRERFADDEDLLEYLVEAASSRPEGRIDGMCLGEPPPAALGSAARPRTPPGRDRT